MPSIAKGRNVLHDVRLSAGSVLTVDIAVAWYSVQVLVLDSSAPVYWTLDGTTPAATGGTSYVIPGGIVAADERTFRAADGPRQVKLVSAAAATLSIQRGD